MNERLEPTNAALVTPKGRGAVASIVVTGAQAVAAVESQFESARGHRLLKQPSGRILFGTWLATGEEVVVVRRSESNVEVHFHGGPAASETILTALRAAGCSIVSWQNLIADQEVSPIRAAARIALAACTTERTAIIMLDQYKGALDHVLERVMQSLSDGQGPLAALELRELLQWERFGQHLTSPWRVVIAGPPNVGKSTLINALVGYQRAIVFDQPGTTRDVVTAGTAIDGWPIELSDTAGIRSGGDSLEQVGAKRAIEALRTADLAILVFDITQLWSPENDRLLSEQPRAIVVHNKCDLLPGNESATEAPADRPDGLLASAKTGLNVPPLCEFIGRRLVPHVPSPGAAIPFNTEQLDAIQSALALADAARYDQAATVLAHLVAKERRQ